MLQIEETLVTMAMGRPPLGSPTISRAAEELGVSVRTVRNWVNDGVIPEPPSQPYGRGSVWIFPPEYMFRAKASLQQHREAVEKARQARRQKRSN
jgi:predicted site-specific integrase-resolvase